MVERGICAVRHVLDVSEAIRAEYKLAFDETNARRISNNRIYNVVANFSGLRHQFLSGLDDFRLDLAKSKQHGGLRGNIPRDPHHDKDEGNVMAP